MMTKAKFYSAAAAAVLLAMTTGGGARAADVVRTRGTVVSLDGAKLVVHPKEGADVTINLAEKFAVLAVIKSSMAEIKPGVFIGTATMTKPDSTLRSMEVVVFPEGMKGTGEGHYPWDLPGSSAMTNATVTNAVKGVDGQTVTMAYKGGEKKVEIPADVPVVTLTPGTAGDIKAGEAVFVPGQRDSEGIIHASVVLFGKDGVVPPM
jgi:hypothetical protein